MVGCSAASSLSDASDQDANLKPFQRKVFKAMGMKLGKNAKKIETTMPAKRKVRNGLKSHIE